MKLKKVFSIALAVAMSLSCVGVFADGIPTDGEFDGDVNKNPFESAFQQQTTVNNTAVNPTKKNDKVTTVVAKTKVKKALKKKSAKKVKITLKKINIANGYQVQISKKKKFKKKAIVFKKFITKKKLVKKAKFSVGNKKVKKQKKLWVRARAYIVKNGVKVYGKWSKVKKVKIK